MWSTLCMNNVRQPGINFFEANAWTELVGDKMPYYHIIH